MSGAELTAALTGRRVLVTGGSGFIGGRLVERLVLEHGARVRALVRTPASAGRLVRFELDLVRGDVTDPAALAAAVEGCDLVFHCAYGTSGSQKQRAWINREGTRRLLAAARAARVARLVHLSTLMVYGRTGDGDLDETAPRRRFGNAYSDSKLAAEKLALAAARRGDLEVAVLQPTAVYGPWGGVWTASPLAALAHGRQILVDGGRGFCNHVYVDDLVDAMLLAAVRPAAAGEAFLISAAEPVPWSEWYLRFARMLPAGVERTVAMSAEHALALWHEHRRRQPWLAGEALRVFRGDQILRERLMAARDAYWLRERASALLSEPAQQRIKSWMSGRGRRPLSTPALHTEELPIQPLTPELIDFLRPRTRVRIDKARRLLGYEPQFDLDRGMALTERWARWAGLLEG